MAQNTVKLPPGFTLDNSTTSPQLPPGFVMDQPAPEPRSAAGFAGNIVKSGGEFVGNLAQAAMSPIQTAKAVGGLAAGVGEKLIPGTQPQEANVDALVKMYVDRYGGIENIKKTVYEDPIGFLADIATVAGGVGGAAKLGGLTKVAEAAGSIAKLTDPLSMAAKIAQPAAKIAGRLPEEWYQSALKVNKPLRNSPKLQGVIASGLENKIPVSPAGVEKLGSLIDDLQQKVSDVIAANPKKSISPAAAARPLGELKQTFRSQALPEADIATVTAGGKEFMRQHSVIKQVPAGTKQVPTGVLDASGNPVMKTIQVTKDVRVPVPIPAEEAQSIKVGTYRQLKSKSYGELKSAQIETEKALARGLKDELATAFPELSALNAKESQMLGLDKALRDAVGRISNHQIFGIGTPLAAAGAEAVTGDAKMAALAGGIKLILDNPNLKSRLAYTIRHVQNTRPAFKAAGLPAATTRVQEYLNRLELQSAGAQP